MNKKTNIYYLNRFKIKEIMTTRRVDATTGTGIFKIDNGLSTLDKDFKDWDAYLVKNGTSLDKVFAEIPQKNPTEKPTEKPPEKPTEKPKD